MLNVHTLHVEKKPLLPLLSIESSSGSEEGSSGQQMMPEHLNKTLSMKVVTQTGIECVHISNVKYLSPNIGLPTLYSVGVFKCFV